MSSKQQNAAHQRSASFEDVWQKRTSLVKQEMAAASAASDAKTARLKALRLEKEQQDAAAAAAAPPRATKGKR